MIEKERKRVLVTVFHDDRWTGSKGERGLRTGGKSPDPV